MKRVLLALLSIMLSVSGVYADVTRSVVFLPPMGTFEGSKPTCNVTNASDYKFSVIYTDNGEKIEFEDSYKASLTPGSLDLFTITNQSVFYLNAPNKIYFEEVNIHITENFQEQSASVILSAGFNGSLSYDIDKSIIIWKRTGAKPINSLEIEFSKSMKADFVEVIYTLEGYDDPVCDDPVIEPKGPSIAPDESIEITCGTEGANIYYTVDGSEPDENSTLYVTSFNLQFSSDMVVKAKAVNGDIWSNTVEQRYYFNKVNNIADFITNANPESTLIDQSLMVLGNPNTTRYLIDDQGTTIRLSGSDAAGLTAGKWITGVTGRYRTSDDGQWLILTEAPKPAISDIQAIQPTGVLVSGLSDKIGRYVAIEGLHLSDDDSGGQLNVVAFDAADNRLSIIDESGALDGVESWQKFSVTGVVTNIDDTPALVLLGIKLADLPDVTVSVRSSNEEFGTASVGDLEESDIEVAPGSSVQLHAVAKEGFKFIGWFSNGDVAVSQDPEYTPRILTNEVYTAKFDYIIAQSRSVTIAKEPLDGGNVWFVNPTADADIATIDTRAYVTVEAQEDDNSKAFLGWFVGDEKVSSQSRYTYTGESDVTLTARFTVSYTIQVEKPEHGDIKITDIDGNIIEWQDGKVRLPKDSPIRFVTIPDEGYTIKAVYINRDGDKGQVANKGQDVTYYVSKDVVLSAEFERITKSVTVKCDEAQGSVTLSSGYNVETGQPTGEIYRPLTAMLSGTQFYVTVHPKVDRYVRSITVDGVSRTADLKRDGYLLLELGIDFMTIEVEFSVLDEQKEYTISVKTDSGEMGSAYIGEPEVNSMVVSDGDPVTVTAVPVRDTRFSHWLAMQIKVSEEPVYTFTPDKNATLTAVFEYLIPERRKVSVASSHADRGTVAIVNPATDGKTAVNTQRYVDVVAEPIGDCRFTGWTDESGLLVSKAPAFTYTAAEPIALTANFTCDFIIKAADCEGGSITFTDIDGNQIAGGSELPEGTEVNVRLEATGYNKIVSVAINGEPLQIQPSQADMTFTITLDCDKEVSAMFSPDKGLGVYVDADIAEGGKAWINTENTTELMVDGGTDVKLYAEPAYGYKFNGWMIDGNRVSTDNPYSTVITRTSAFTALFDYQIDVERTIRIGVSDPAKGTVRFVDPATTAVELTTRQFVKIEATPNSDDHTFVNWTNGQGNIVSLSPTFVYESGRDASLTANFVSRYTVTYSEGEKGKIIVADRENNPIASGSRVAEGAVIAITLVPDSGYKLKSLNINGEDMTNDYNAARQYTYVVTAPTDIRSEFIDLASAISITEADITSGVWYDLSGKRVDPDTAPRPAIYILVTGSEKRKVLLK